ncbi:MAG: hypothetical protein ACP5T5_05605 [Thermoprotei archaeon]|nr:hypothetical protein [TACK group archaeon]
MKSSLKVAKPYDQVILEFLLEKNAKKVYVSEKEIIDHLSDEFGEVDRKLLNRVLMRMEIRGLISVQGKDSTKLVSLAE